MARSNKGFSIVEVLIVILVLALVGFIGWKVWDTMNQPTTDEGTSQQQPASDDMKSEEDLDKADKTLDDTNVDGTEAQQLELETSF